MCLAIPGEIIKIEGIKATVDYGGIQKECRIDVVKADKGDWILVHAGYAISVLDEKEAKKTLELLDEVI